MTSSQAPPRLRLEDRKALALIERVKKLQEKPPQSEVLPQRRPPKSLVS